MRGSDSDVSMSVPHSAAYRLRALISRQDMIPLPGVHDGFSARAAEELGFEAVYVGGGIATGVNLGIPDMGLVTMDQLIDHAARIASVIDIPVIADLDDCGGNPMRIRRTVQQAERAGIAGLQIEDNDYSQGKHFPAKPGSGEGMKSFDFSRDRPIEREPAIERVRAAVEARRNPDTVIIARTDACLFSLDEAIARARLYADAGADMIYLGHMTPQDTKRAVDEIPIPLMGGSHYRPEGATVEELELLQNAGLRLHFYPGATAFAAYEASWKVLEDIKQTGVIPTPFSKAMARVSTVVRHQEWGQLAERYKMI
jgi:2-methylisocitrate lyase-like PEP mutase family enzyme